MSDTEVITEPIILIWDQIVALYVGLNEHARHREIDFLGSSATEIPLPAPLPRCPVCGAAPRELRQHTDQAALRQEYTFGPCSHIVYVAEADIQQLWKRTQYRPQGPLTPRGVCSCRAEHCSGCWLGSDLDHPDELGLRRDR